MKEISADEVVEKLVRIATTVLSDNIIDRVIFIQQF